MKLLVPLLASSSAVVVQAIKVNFYLGPSCTSQSLYAEVYDQEISCMETPEGAVNSQSVIAAGTGDNDNGLEVIFYGTSDCTGRPIAAVASHTICISNQDDVIKSYSVQVVGDKDRRRKIKKRTPREVETAIQGLFASNGLDLFGRDKKGNSSELGPPKHYDVGHISDIGDVAQKNVENLHTFLTAGAFVTIEVASLISLVSGCIGVEEATDISQVSCATSIIAAGISFLGAAYHGYESYRAIMAHMRNNNFSLGPRGMDSQTISVTPEEYMDWLLDSIGIEGTHVGYHKRRDFESPVYQFSYLDGTDYHLHVSPNANGEVRHTLSFARNSIIEKRQGYEGVTVIGGVDISARQRAEGDSSHLPAYPEEAYDYYYKDIECLISEDELLNSNYVAADILDRSGYTVLTVNMVPYLSDSDENYAEQLEACNNNKFHFDQTCVN